MVSTGLVITSSTGVSGATAKTTRRTTSCSVMMPTARPASSVTRALEASTAAIRATTVSHGVPAGTVSGVGPMKSRTSWLKMAVRERNVISLPEDRL